VGHDQVSSPRSERAVVTDHAGIVSARTHGRGD
jgi:hypothetical protein